MTYLSVLVGGGDGEYCGGVGGGLGDDNNVWGFLEPRGKLIPSYVHDNLRPRLTTWSTTVCGSDCHLQVRMWQG